VSQSVVWTVVASEVSPSRVIFSVDGVVVSTDTASPFTTTLDTTTLLNGVRVLTATARARGKTASTSVRVSVANPLATPPSTTTPPTISGATTVAQTLAAAPGSWSGTTPLTYGYQWRRCDTAGGSCQDVTNASASRYTLSSNDQGHRMRVAVTASNTAGVQTSSSAATDVVLNTPAPAPSASALPAVGIAAGADLQEWSEADVNRQLDDYARLHARWIRHDFSWDKIEPQKGQFSWGGYDALVSAARSRAIEVIATVTYTPAWANGGHADHNYAPSSADEFGRFAGDVARRYATQGVHRYEIWNEPNIGFWKPLPDPVAYTAVLRAASIAIHAADPLAVVVTGGTSPAGDGPSTFSPQTWLSQLYANGAKPYFDAVGHHPYVDAWSNWEAMADYQVNLRQIMTANGDATKRIDATEVGCNRNAVSDCTSRLATAFAKWKSYAWAGVLAWFIYWDPNVYGLVDGSWNPRPLWYAYEQAAAPFS